MFRCLGNCSVNLLFLTAQIPQLSSFPSICNVIIILNFKGSGQSLFSQEASYSSINLPTNNCRERVLEKTVFEKVYKNIFDTFLFVENNVYYLFYIYTIYMDA